MYPSQESYNPNYHMDPFYQKQQPVYPEAPPSYLNAQSIVYQAPSQPPPQPPPTMIVTTQPNVMVVPQPSYNDYLGLSIMNIIFCCLPIGIAAAIFSCKTREAIHRGDMPLAGSNSRTAFTLNMVALGLGIAVNIVWIAIVIYLNVTFRSTYSNYYNNFYEG